MARGTMAAALQDLRNDQVLILWDALAISYYELKLVGTMQETHAMQV